jgi:CheY-like chemotaxis protein
MKQPHIHFLFAEDDPLMVDLYKNAFEFAGYSLEVAKDGIEALQKLTQANPKPNLVILDVMMPNASGFDVLEQIRQDSDLKDLPVVILSNLTGEEHEARARALGAKAYLVKSNYTPKQVVDEIVALAKT